MASLSSSHSPATSFPSSSSASTTATIRSTPLIARGHTRPVNSLNFSPLEADGQHYLLVSSCKDGTPMLRDGSTGDWLGSFIGHKGCCWSIKLSANTQRAISGSADFTAKVWDATDGSCLLTLPHDHIVRCADLNNDGTRAITGGHEKKLRLWDIEALLLSQHHEQQQRQQEHLRDGSGASSSDASSSAAGSSNGTAERRSSNESPASSSKTSSTKSGAAEAATATAMQSGEFLTSEGKSAHSGTIKSVVWDERNNQIISAGEDKLVKFWNLDTLQCEHEIATESAITSMERGHDERGTISLTYGNKVEFIDPRTRKPFLTHTLQYPPSTASLHPIVPDRFVTGSTADGWVRVHDAATGEEREVYKGHHGPVHAISYSPDGELYASGSEDGTIRLWQTSPKTYGLWRYDGNGAS